MAGASRASRAAPWCLLAAAACVLAAGGRASPAAAVATGGAQQQIVDVLVPLLTLVVQFVITAVPGLTVAFVGYMVYSRRERMSPKAWGGIAVLVLGCALLSLRMGGQSAGGDGGAPTPAGMISPDQVRSGEALVRNGRFVRLPDPTKEEGEALEQGWQRALAGAMTEAIRNGQEQVMLVFSRQGCPWCDKQKPVLERMIRKRVSDIASRNGGGDAAAAFVGGGVLGAEGLLYSPLRVFVLDAAEFPYLAQQFRIEAFPTSMVFGPPGATPLVAQGFLDDETLDKILQTAAVSGPPSPGRKRKRGLFR